MFGRSGFLSRRDYRSMGGFLSRGDCRCREAHPTRRGSPHQTSTGYHSTHIIYSTYSSIFLTTISHAFKPMIFLVFSVILQLGVYKLTLSFKFWFKKLAVNYAVCLRSMLMSLHVLLNKEEVTRRGIQLESFCDDYFDANVSLGDSDFDREVISQVEGGAIVSPRLFKGQFSEKALDKRFLSTGAKTLLCIKHNPHICFDVSCCGSNALALLCKLTKGYILWKFPVLCHNSGVPCDITCLSKRYTDFGQFLSDLCFIHTTGELGYAI